jgi:hypothetical protein
LKNQLKNYDKGEACRTRGRDWKNIYKGLVGKSGLKEYLSDLGEESK